MTIEGFIKNNKIEKLLVKFGALFWQIFHAAFHFGDFDLHHRTRRIARNPKTGSIKSSAKEVPHFKPGKDMTDRVEASRNQCVILE